MFRTKLALALALVCCLESPAFAEQGDREKPMNIQADNCNYEQKAQRSVCTHNVVVTQGTMTIYADRLVITQDADGNQFAHGEGKPVRFKQRLDKSTDWLEAESQRFNYDGKKGFLQLFDKAWVRKSQDVVHGDHITYDLNTELYQAKSKPGGRVNITIVPKKKEAKAAP
ncbi:lipopolysaccharide export system protein LptA [Formivibrio citricus]|uniref:Lipopolysaccharide export system protein LptA n=2 Tax=Formivibrio citricus TaxID=83765 RepID=A0A1I4XRN3_9NEIS|nr:lipopolysaccharide transport periplasmic protein LptA [Formivibrio citricus]SFN27949.1 lipopolysaccharide export system protein LptA [Formivibrio citricus]